MNGWRLAGCGLTLVSAGLAAFCLVMLLRVALDALAELNAILP